MKVFLNWVICFFIYSFSRGFGTPLAIAKSDFKLKLEPAEIELRPDENKYINAIVTNQGKMDINILLSIPDLSTSDLDVEINQPKIIDISPNSTAVFNISIRAKKGAKEDIISIVIVAESSKVAGYDQVVEQKATLTVKILAQGKHDIDKSPNPYENWIILLICLISIPIDTSLPSYPEAQNQIHSLLDMMFTKRIRGTFTFK